MSSADSRVCPGRGCSPFRWRLGRAGPLVPDSGGGSFPGNYCPAVRSSLSYVSAECPQARKGGGTKKFSQKIYIVCMYIYTFVCVIRGVAEVGRKEKKNMQSKERLEDLGWQSRARASFAQSESSTFRPSVFLFNPRKGLTRLRCLLFGRHWGASPSGT